MCGDSIIIMCNAKYVKVNMNKNILTRDTVLTSVKRLLGQLQSRSISKVRGALRVESVGIKTPRDRRQRKDIGARKGQKDLQLRELIDITKSTQKRRNRGTRNMDTVEEVIMRVILTGRRLTQYQTNVLNAGALRILPLTILNPFQRAVQTTLKTYKNYAENVMQVRGQGGVYL